nr:hypothetical protein [Acidimicrobiia bacterium]
RHPHSGHQGPMIPGHEMVGRVVESDSPDLPPGTLVAGAASVPCWDCDRCREGRTNICQRLYSLGLNAPGSHAEYVAGPARSFVPLPERAAYARWNGTAPIPVWTANPRFRLSRGGNRQVNAAIHRIAITQWRGQGAGHDYIKGRIERGDTKRSAIRALKRRISDEVFRRLHTDLAHRQPAPLEDAA